MPLGPSRARVFSLTTSLGLVAAALVLWAGPAQAATCPTVDPSTGAVTPAPGPGVQWAGCDLTGANLQVANLTSANLTSANLTNALLADSTVTGASLAGATLTGASGIGIKGSPASLPTHWSVAGGYLIGPGAGTDLTDANLNRRNLSGVGFGGLNLLRATFEHANLTSANLTKANLTGADFTSANLTKADLDGAKISSTDFTSTVWSDTICPNGRNSNSYPKRRCYAAPPKSPFTARALPTVSGDPVNGFIPTAISCPTATRCSAGATYFDRQSGADVAALLHWDSIDWSETPAPLPSDKSRNPRAASSLTAISCPSATRCHAGGGYESTVGNDAMLLSWSGNNWTAAKAPLPAGAPSNPDAALTGMACPSLTSCFAVGYYSAANRENGLILRWAGGKWSASSAPTPAGDPDLMLTGVSCPSTTLCFAAGTYESGAQTEPLILRWSSGKWAVVKVPLPAGAATSPQIVMGGLSCPGTTHCVAVGSYFDTNGHEQGVLLTRSGTTWTAAKAPLLAGAAGNPWVSLNAVSCPTASQCTVGGGYQNTAAQSEGLLLVWSGKTWKAEPTPRGAYMVKGISCPTTTRCVAVSPDVNGPVALTGP